MSSERNFGTHSLLHNDSILSTLPARTLISPEHSHDIITITTSTHRGISRITFRGVCSQKRTIHSSSSSTTPSQPSVSSSSALHPTLQQQQQQCQFCDGNSRCLGHHGGRVTLFRSRPQDLTSRAIIGNNPTTNFASASTRCPGQTFRQHLFLSLGIISLRGVCGSSTVGDQTIWAVRHYGAENGSTSILLQQISRPMIGMRRGERQRDQRPNLAIHKY